MSLPGRLFREIGKHVPAGLARLAGRPAAVFFHGVEPVTDDPRLQTNHHETAVFRAITASLKRHFDVLPIEALGDVLAHPERNPRALFLMSDDGYANTLSVAADILEEEGLSWTLFVSSHHIDTSERNPVFLARLFAFFADAGSYRLPHLHDEAVLDSDRVQCAEALLSCLKHLNGPDARQTIDAMMKRLPEQRLAGLLRRFRSEEFLTWDGVRALAARGVAIGAHAHWHWPMNAAQSESYLRQQASLPRNRIEAEVGPCRVFAYPFGNVGDVGPLAWRAVRDAGYEHGFTTLSGSLDGRMNPWLLPRYGLGVNASGAASTISLLRAGNSRVRDWQTALAR